MRSLRLPFCRSTAKLPGQVLIEHIRKHEWVCLPPMPGPWASPGSLGNGLARRKLITFRTLSVMGDDRVKFAFHLTWMCPFESHPTDSFTTALASNFIEDRLKLSR